MRNRSCLETLSVLFHASTRDITYRGLAVLTLAVIAVGSILQSPIQDDENHSQQNPTANAPNSKREKESFWIRTVDDPVALFTLVLSISTIGLWVVTWRGMSAQSRDMRKSLQISKVAAEAAKDAANAASEQVAIAKKTAEIPLRAYVVIGAIDVDRQTGEVVVQVLNKGNTPANNITISYRSEWHNKNTSFTGHADRDPEWTQIAPGDRDCQYRLYDMVMRDAADDFVEIHMGINYDDWFGASHTCALSFIVDNANMIMRRHYKTD